MPVPDLILRNGKITTLDRENPQAEAVAMRDGRFLAAGSEHDVMGLATADTTVVDLKGRRVIPGLIDSHMHIIRGGLNYNMELRWDGVRSLADAMAMLKEQVARTPAPQWVRVIGGFTEHQFAEKRLPTLDEINAVAPDTPVFLLHLYDRALLNRAALRAVGYTKDTPEFPGAEIVRDSSGEPTGLLVAKPNATVLYATLAKGPKLPPDYQKNSTRHFMREVNRLGVTSVIDAGGGFQNYPEDYGIIEELHRAGELTVRIAYNLFTQKPKAELNDFASWAKQVKPGQGDDTYRNNGAGEMLVYSAADYEDFQVERPDLPPTMENELEPVIRLLAENRWPWRLHATYNQTITRALDVFEKVARDVPLTGLHWFIDHAETIDDRNIERVARLGGGIAVQHRMAYQGEYFVERYGARAAERTPPVRRMLDMGVPVGAGTDATRVASYNPWVSLSWLVTGKTLGGTALYPASNRLDRETALRLWTEANTWFSTEPGKKGQIKAGQLADLAVLSDDYFAVPEDTIQDITSVLTLLGGKAVHGDGDFKHLAPPLPPPMPDWSPVRRFGGYQARARGDAARQNAFTAACGCDRACNVHGHAHAGAWASNVPVADTGFGVHSVARAGRFEETGGVMDASLADIGVLAARVCLSAVFLWSGWTKLTDRAAGLAEVKALGLPAPVLCLALTIACQLAGGLMVLLGFWTRLGALALAGFTVVATLIAHRYWHLSGMERTQQRVICLEHLAIVGGFIMLIVYGGGSLSLDHWLR